MPLVRRPREEQLLETVEDSAIGTRLRTPPLVEDHTALGLDLRLFDGRCRQPLLEHVEPGLDHGVVGGRHGEFVDGLVVGRVGVDVGAEGRTEAPQHVDEFVLGELLGAVEQHVFEEVRPARLRLVFECGSGVDDQSHVDACARIVVVTDQIPQAVVEFADDDRRVGFGNRRQPVRIGCRDRCRPIDRGRRRRAAGAAVVSGPVFDSTSATSELEVHDAASSPATMIAAPRRRVRRTPRRRRRCSRPGLITERDYEARSPPRCQPERAPSSRCPRSTRHHAGRRAVRRRAPRRERPAHRSGVRR